MTTYDYLAHLNDIPRGHSGVICEQIHQAALSATFYLRAMGLPLPGVENVPTYADVYGHLCCLINEAMGAYFDIQKNEAPPNQKADDIWGEAEDALFSVEVTGLTESPQTGFTAEIEFNLLYRA